MNGMIIILVCFLVAIFITLFIVSEGFRKFIIAILDAALDIFD